MLWSRSVRWRPGCGGCCAGPVMTACACWTMVSGRGGPRAGRSPASNRCRCVAKSSYDPAACRVIEAAQAAALARKGVLLYTRTAAVPGHRTRRPARRPHSWRGQRAVHRTPRHGRPVVAACGSVVLALEVAGLTTRLARLRRWTLAPGHTGASTPSSRWPSTPSPAEYPARRTFPLLRLVMHRDPQPPLPDPGSGSPAVPSPGVASFRLYFGLHRHISMRDCRRLCCW
jgi:hypothetical protein